MAPNNQENGSVSDEVYTWEEVRKHNNPDDLWVVIDGHAYDVTRFKDKHPGFAEILIDSAGQDATRSFQWYHKDLSKPKRYMGAYRKGKVEAITDPRWIAMDKDVDELEVLCKKMGLFNTSWLFHLTWFANYMFTICLSYFLVATFPNSWIALVVSGLLMGMSHFLSGVHSHDFGHRYISHTRFWDSLFMAFSMNIVIGISGKFWCAYHHRHHTKPNIIDKDPTIKINETFFVVGTKVAERMAKEKAKENEKPMLYQYQHFYWFFVGVPLYIPVLFQIASFKYCIRRKDYVELLLWMSHFVWYSYLFGSVLGWWAVLHFLIGRQLMTHWFVWTSLSNHLALDPVHDDPSGWPWLDIQMTQTVNLTGNRFFQWYHGGLNFQIEHHIYPHMPRDKWPLVAPLIEELCKKHGVPYRVLGTLEAYAQVYNMLKNSGARFLEVYMDALSGK